MSESALPEGNRKAKTIIIAYPFGVMIIAFFINHFVFGVNPVEITLPSIDHIGPLIIAITLLFLNHAWLMTNTELTRVKFKLYATPEEWEASGTHRENASAHGLSELERHHNAHRNTTENTLYFVALALVFVIISPPVIATQIWVTGYSTARLGYTYGYLAGKDALRGLFMTLSLLALFGMASYSIISLTL